MTKQYHLRVDDPELDSSISHELAERGGTRTDLVLELLRRGLKHLREEREREAVMAYLAKSMGVSTLANPDRVNYSDEARSSALVPGEEQE